MSDDIFERFRACAVSVLSVPAEKVTLTASFANDLDADSLDLVEFVMALEEEFDVNVEEEELEGIDTVGGLIFNRLGQLPKKGQELQIGGLHVKVRRVSRKRVDEVMLFRALGGEERA